MPSKNIINDNQVMINYLEQSSLPALQGAALAEVPALQGAACARWLVDRPEIMSLCTRSLSSCGKCWW